MKRCLTLTRSSELEPHHQTQFSVILRTTPFGWWWVHHSSQYAMSIICASLTVKIKQFFLFIFVDTKMLKPSSKIALRHLKKNVKIVLEKSYLKSLKNLISGCKKEFYWIVKTRDLDKQIFVVETFFLLLLFVIISL